MEPARRSTRGLDRRTTFIAASVLLILGGIVFEPAIAHGGFYADDWENGASAVFYYEQSSIGPFRPAFQPLLSVLTPLPHLLFGPHPAWHLALALVVGVAASLAFAAVLVRTGLSRLDAVAIAALALILPASDSVRLYSTAAINSIALIPA